MTTHSDSSREQPPAGLPRTSTGVPGLDVVTGGGLPSGRATIVAGTSGSGKTVLGLQFLWAGAQSLGEPAVLVTFEERPEDLFANVAAFGWDLAALVRDGQLAVVDATPEDDVAMVGGFDFGGLLARIEHALRQTGAQRVLIDAMDAVFGQFSDADTVRRELAKVLRRMRELNVTTLMTIERTEEYGSVARRDVEEFVADNVIILRNALGSKQRRRTVEVLKLRGANHNKGEYAFVIAPGRGIQIVPLSAIESDRAASFERISFGNAELDEMCAGGMYRDSLVLISGATGTGKSQMAAAFLAAGLAAGERAMLLSFEENPAQIVRNARSCGTDLMGPVQDGSLQIVSRFPERMGLEDLLVAIETDIERHDPQRVVIDSLTAVENSTSPDAFRDLVIGIAAFLKARGVAALMITTPPDLMGADAVSGVEISTMTDGIVLLRYVELDGELRRAIMVLKMRGTAHDRSLHEFEMTNEGIRVRKPLRGVSGMLGGTARLDPIAREPGS